MSESESWLLLLLAAPLAIAALIAAGVAYGVARAISAAGALMNAGNVENSVRLDARQRAPVLGAQYARQCGSNALTTALATRQTVQTLARGQASLDALRANSYLSAVATQWHGPTLQQAAQTLQQAQVLSAAGQMQRASQLATQAESALLRATYDSHQRLAQGQRHVVGNSLKETLTGLGFTLHTASDDRGMGILANRGAVSVAAAVTGNGTVDIDAAGFDGTTCRQEIEQIVRTLGERGVQVRREQAVVHRRRSGGELIGSAARLARQTNVRPEQAVLETAAGAHDVNRGKRDHADLERRARAWLWQQQVRS